MALYKYRPASVWALARLCVADRQREELAADIRNALFVGFGLKKKGRDDPAAAQRAVDDVWMMLKKFEGGANEG